jgi:hypothetical protein
MVEHPWLKKIDFAVRGLQTAKGFAQRWTNFREGRPGAKYAEWRMEVANGIFANTRFRSGWPDLNVRLEDAQQVQSGDVITLVNYVQQVSGQACAYPVGYARAEATTQQRHLQPAHAGPLQPAR